MEYLEAIFKFIETYGTSLSAVGAAGAFIFTVYKYVTERNTTHFWKEFETYHKLVKELVEPETPDSAMRIDRQTAIIYELKFYERYTPHTLRMLTHLKEQWSSTPEQFPRLIEELDLMIEFLQNKVK